MPAKTKQLAGVEDPFLAALRNAVALISARRAAEAEPIVKRLLSSHSARHETYHIAGVLASALKRRTDAMTYFEKAVQLAPGNAVYWQNLGAAYLDLDFIEKSFQAFGHSIKIDPHQFEALFNGGEILRKIGRAESGLEYLDAALRLRPKDKQALLSKGASLETLGRVDEAEAHYRSIMNSGIDPAIVLHRLANVRKRGRGDPLFAEIAKSLSRTGLRDAYRQALRLALGKVNDDVGDHDAAFENYVHAHALAKQSFDLQAHRNNIDALIKTFTAEYISERAKAGDADERPVFVVGMPRSGTTLTEQIAASHPHSHGAGELSRMHKIARLMGYRADDIQDFCRNAVQAGPPDFARLAAGYRSMMDFLDPNARRIIDKMPHNFMHLGLIAVLFPNARIVHCTRHPIDTCVSIFMNHMSKAHAYGGDLATLGLYYREYRRLMDHWKSVLPLPVFEMSYEETTRDLDGQARKLIDFIGLPWDDACLKFNENKSTVQTISNWQVRQPIYTTSVERWRRYEKHLGPLIEALGDLADVKAKAPPASP